LTLSDAYALHNTDKGYTNWSGLCFYGKIIHEI